MIYYAKITKQKDKRFLVEFPRLPGCLTEGKTLQQAMDNAREALNGWLAVRVDRDFKIPTHTRLAGPNLYPIEVDIQIMFAFRLRDLRKRRGFTQTQVARKLGISQQAYAKLEAPLQANPSLSTLQRLSDVFDADIDLRMVA